MAVLVPDILREQAAKTTGQTAIDIVGSASMTYGEWEARSNRLARALVKAGLKPGDRVALWFTNEDALDYAVGYFAIQKAGGVTVPVNARLTARESAWIMEHSATRFLLAQSRQPLELAAILKLAPAGLKAVTRGGLPGTFGWDSFESGQSTDTIQVERAPDDLADILYTSGTTGFPKGVASTHANVALVTKGRLGAMFAGQTFLHAVPYYTFAGTHAMLMLPLTGGMTSVVLPKFDAALFLELIAERKAALLYAVPSMLMLMLRDPSIGEHDYRSLKMILYGTAPMPPEGIRGLAQRFPQAMQINVYGLTEAGGAGCTLPPTEALKRPGSIGKPLPPTEIRICDGNGRELPAGKQGEIWLRTPGNRRRYFNNEQATRETWTEDGWLKTGDVGHFDTDGYLYIDDRLKDMIIRGGHNIFALEVENVLYEHPAVAEAAVVGVPHTILGEDVKAFIVLRDGFSPAADELQAFCAERLADYKRPRQIEFVRELPRNALGKVLKRVLRGGDTAGAQTAISLPGGAAHA